jgi:hypothetical protein
MARTACIVRLGAVSHSAQTTPAWLRRFARSNVPVRVSVEGLHGASAPSTRRKRWTSALDDWDALCAAVQSRLGLLGARAGCRLSGAGAALPVGVAQPHPGFKRDQAGALLSRVAPCAVGPHAEQLRLKAVEVVPPVAIVGGDTVLLVERVDDGFAGVAADGLHIYSIQ